MASTSFGVGIARIDSKPDDVIVLMSRVLIQRGSELEPLDSPYHQRVCLFTTNLCSGGTVLTGLREGNWGYPGKPSAHSSKLRFL